MSCFLHVRRGPVAFIAVLAVAAMLTACTLETREPVFSRDDIVTVDAEKAAKMGFTPIAGGKTWLYRDGSSEYGETCAEVGFVPLDEEGRFYIAANLGHPCIKEQTGYFHMLADFGAVTLKPFAQDKEHRKPVRQLAFDHGIRLLYDDMYYRYVAVGEVSKTQMKAFFLALAASELTEVPKD